MEDSSSSFILLLIVLLIPIILSFKPKIALFLQILSSLFLILFSINSLLEHNYISYSLATNIPFLNISFNLDSLSYLFIIIISTLALASYFLPQKEYFTTSYDIWELLYNYIVEKTMNFLLWFRKIFQIGIIHVVIFAIAPLIKGIIHKTKCYLRGQKCAPIWQGYKDFF